MTFTPEAYHHTTFQVLELGMRRPPFGCTRVFRGGDPTGSIDRTTSFPRSGHILGTRVLELPRQDCVARSKRLTRTPSLKDTAMATYECVMQHRNVISVSTASTPNSFHDARLLGDFYVATRREPSFRFRDRISLRLNFPAVGALQRKSVLAPNSSALELCARHARSLS